MSKKLIDYDWQKHYPGSSLGGFVTSPNFFTNNKNKIIDENGLLSQRIFGPINDYRCKCGKLKLKVDAGKVCPKCGVVCGPSNLRSKVFGKIKLPLPVFKKLKVKKLTPFIKKNTVNSLILNTTRLDVSIEESRYFCIGIDGSLKFFDKVSEIDFNFYRPLPLKISGVFSLIIALEYLISRANNLGINQIVYGEGGLLEIFHECVSDILPVLPPNLRPVTVDKVDPKTLYVGEINKEGYCLLLQFINRRKQLSELYSQFKEEIFEILDTAMEDDERDELEFLQFYEEKIPFSMLFEFEKFNASLQYYVNKIYDLTVKLIHGKEGLIRSSMLARILEFSARCVVVIDPSLKPWQIKVPKSILFKLWRAYFINWLITKKNLDYDWCYSKILLHHRDKQVDTLFDQFLDYFTETTLIKRLAFFNRAPTLWRHGIPGVEIIPDKEDSDVIGVSPLILEPMNMDFDGDQASLYILHDLDALNELKQKALYGNEIFTDQNFDFLAKLRHEALYAAFILTQDQHNNNLIGEFESLTELDERFNNIEFIDEHIYDLVKINGEVVTVGVAVFNKWCGFKTIKCKFTIDKKSANKLYTIIYKSCDQNRDYFERLYNLENKLFLFLTFSKQNPTVSTKELVEILPEDYEHMFENLPDKNPLVGYLLNEVLIDKVFNEKIDKNSQIYKIYKSGSRVSKTQLARSCLNIGYISDSFNIVFNKPITSNYLKGLDERIFFESSFGARKGISDKSKHTPDSGYLERTLVMGLSVLEITEDDCGSEGLEIEVINEKHARMLRGKVFFNPDKNDWDIFREEFFEKFIGKKIRIRSVINCKTPNYKMCRKCFGYKILPTDHVGIVAGQCLTERITQLIMRTFHTSGSAELDYDEGLYNILSKDLLDLRQFEGKVFMVLNYSQSNEQYLSKNFSVSKTFSKTFNKDVLLAEIPELTEKIENKDTITTLKIIRNEILKQINKQDEIKHPVEYYQNLIELISSVGEVYSSYAEMLFANMFYVKWDDNDRDERLLWRYAQNLPIVKKLDHKSIVKSISSLMYLLYEPNAKSVLSFEENFFSDEYQPKTAYEKIALLRI